jgi:Uma2 family endonuclease
MSVDVVRRLFTADEYFQMIEAGILAADDRVELIEGEILEMPPRAPDHNASTAILNRMLVLGIGLAASSCPGERFGFRPDLLRYPILLSCGLTLESIGTSIPSLRMCSCS